MTMKLKRLKTFFFFTLAKIPMNGWTRSWFVSLGGVQLVGGKCFIGEGVTFDTMYPNNIHIGESTHVTTGCVILAHYLNTNGGPMWRSGDVYIGEKSFLGAKTIICKDVRIGKNCIVAAGSVVTKDIPDNEIWGGNPAKFLKKRVPWNGQDPKDFE